MPPLAPKNLTVFNSSETSLELSWDYDPSVTNYNFFITKRGGNLEKTLLHQEPKIEYVQVYLLTPLLKPGITNVINAIS